MARDYKSERANYFKKPEQMKNNASRKQARRIAEKMGIASPKDGRDVIHKNGDPQDNRPSNLAVQHPSKNRSYPRTKTAAKRNKTD